MVATVGIELGAVSDSNARDWNRTNLLHPKEQLRRMPLGSGKMWRNS